MFTRGPDLLIILSSGAAIDHKTCDSDDETFLSQRADWQEEKNQIIPFLSVFNSSWYKKLQPFSKCTLSLPQIGLHSISPHKGWDLCFMTCGNVFHTGGLVLWARLIHLSVYVCWIRKAQNRLVNYRHLLSKRGVRCQVLQHEAGSPWSGRIAWTNALSGLSLCHRVRPPRAAQLHTTHQWDSVTASRHFHQTAEKTIRESDSWHSTVPQ